MVPGGMYMATYGNFWCVRENTLDLDKQKLVKNGHAWSLVTGLVQTHYGL